MSPGSYDAFLAREVDEHMADEIDEDLAQLLEPDGYDDDGEASDYALMGCCP